MHSKSGTRRRGGDRIPVSRHPGLYVKPSGSYQFRIQVDGKRRWITIPGGAIGVQAAAQYRNRYLGRQAPVPTNVKFVDFANEWLENRDLKPRTKALYRAQIEAHLKPLHHRKLNSITTDDVRRIISEMRGAGLKGGTIRNALVPLSAIFSTLVADGKVEHNPVKQLEVGTVPSGGRVKPVIITAAQAKALLERAPSLTWRVYLALGLYAGLRQSEALGLTWDDVDFERGELLVRQQLGRDRALASLKGKENASKERTVEMSEGLRKLLVERRLATGGRGFVVCTNAGGPTNHRNATRMLDTIKMDVESYTEVDPKTGKDVNRSPIERLTYHQLRHNFASALIGAGADVVYVSHQLGHASPSITMDIYAHEFRSVREKGSAAKAIDAAFGTGS